MNNINRKSQEIYNLLKTYIKNNYTPKHNEQISVLTSVVDKAYPLVVFETNSNTLDSITQDAYRLDQVRNLSFEISVFAVNVENVNSNIICDELSNLICEIMNVYYGMQGGLDAKLQNINTAKATKYVLHFNCKWNTRTNIIY